MKDTIIKGSGNSRTLASVPNFLTLYPTYEAFAQALINRELPIDLGPLNSAGCAQIGNDLNKETLLKDATAALYGKPATAVPDDIFSEIASTLAMIKTNSSLVRLTVTAGGTPVPNCRITGLKAAPNALEQAKTSLEAKLDSIDQQLKKLVDYMETEKDKPNKLLDKLKESSIWLVLAAVLGVVLGRLGL